MTMFDKCPREKEVTELVERGQWPEAASPEIAAHVRECRACADLALVADAFQWARANAAGPRSACAPGLLWWRAQLRRREAAMERMGKPILGAQIFALVVNLAVAAGLVAWEATHGVNWLGWFAAARQDGGVGSLLSAAFSGWGLVAAVPALAALALLAGAAVYLGSDR